MYQQEQAALSQAHHAHAALSGHSSPQQQQLTSMQQLTKQSPHHSLSAHSPHPVPIQSPHPQPSPHNQQTSPHPAMTANPSPYHSSMPHHSPTPTPSSYPSPRGASGSVASNASQTAKSPGRGVAPPPARSTVQQQLTAQQLQATANYFNHMNEAAQAAHMLAAQRKSHQAPHSAMYRHDAAAFSMFAGGMFPTAATGHHTQPPSAASLGAASAHHGARHPMDPHTQQVRIFILGIY